MAIDSATIALARIEPMKGLESLKGASKQADGAGFANKLEQAVQSVSEVQVRADDQLRGVASGENVDIHNTMIALQEADIALRTMVSVRDKVVEAYQTVMNMTI